MLDVRERQDGRFVVPSSLDDHLEQGLDLESRGQPSGLGRNVNHRLENNYKRIDSVSSIPKLH
jgi:hypothetical protein